RGTALYWRPPHRCPTGPRRHRLAVFWLRRSRRRRRRCRRRRRRRWQCRGHRALEHLHHALVVAALEAVVPAVSQTPAVLTLLARVAAAAATAAAATRSGAAATATATTRATAATVPIMASARCVPQVIARVRDQHGVAELVVVVGDA